MNRRFSALALAALMCAPLLGWAADDDEPVLAAPKIIEALNPKDIVLDSPGQPATPRRDPTVRLRVQFTFGSAELLPQGKRQLDQLAMALSDAALATAAFELAGHTDAVGDRDANLRLSLERADAVRVYLVQAHGLTPARLQTIGYGYARLADPGNPMAATNRRVEVRRLRTAAASPAPAPAAAAEMPSPGGRLVPTPQ